MIDEIDKRSRFSFLELLENLDFLTMVQYNEHMFKILNLTNADK